MTVQNKIVLSTFALLASVLFSCTNTISEVKEIGEFKELPVKESFNVTYLRSHRARVSNRLTAPVVHQFKNSNTVMPEGFLLEFLDSNLATTAYLEANYGEIIREENLMIARDSVILVNFKNEELYSEELIWSQDSAKIYTEQYIKIKRDDVVIHGKGFESTEDFSKYTIKKVTGQYYLDEEELDGEVQENP